ncbi:zinc finger protein 488 [Pelodytes ibericus]
MQRGEIPFRGTHPDPKEEQLLVWYDGQTCRVLDLQALRDSMAAQGFQCPGCEQEFQGQGSFLSHTCLLCSKGKDNKRLKRGTNFHSLARDMERAGDESCKSVLLEKTNCLDRAFSPSKKEEGSKMGLISSSRSMARKLLKAEMVDHKSSAFSEFQRAKGLQNAGGDGVDVTRSAFSPVLASRKMSAFTKPGKACRAEGQDLCDTIDSITEMRVIDFQNHFPAPPKYFSLSDCPLSHPLPEVWPKPEAVSQTHPSQLLPPTYTPLGVTAQNWCAKCKLSFSMTSDLVLHMRSRHKRETGVETQRRRRRELQLSCPVCYASFRERHHLSRHMTSHC